MMTGRNTKNGQVVAKQSGQARLSKNHKDYWKEKLTHTTYTQNGKRFTVPNWCVRIQHRGRREMFNLGTTNKAVAAKKAKDIYNSLQVTGWENTLQIHKPGMAKKVTSPTVGEFLEAIEANCGINPRTFLTYATKFRQLVSGINGLEGDESKHDHIGPGNQEWLKKINAVNLHSITAEKIQKWKLAFIAKAGNKDPRQKKKATHTVNSIISNAKTLFGPKHLNYIKGLELPKPLPFEGIRLEGGKVSRYRSEIDPIELLALAKKELSVPIPRKNLKAILEAKSKNAQYIIFLLALGAGLRRNEIDKLEWESILWDRAKIRIQATKYFEPKTEDSAGDIDIDSGLLEILRKHKATSKGPFVIPGELPKASKGVYQYRCRRQLKAIVAWLREKGVNAQNPLHTLRKEFGSVICQQWGIFQASEALRHSSIGVTWDSYLAKKDRVIFKI